MFNLEDEIKRATAAWLAKNAAVAPIDPSSKLYLSLTKRSDRDPEPPYDNWEDRQKWYLTHRRPWNRRDE